MAYTTESVRLCTCGKTAWTEQEAEHVLLKSEWHRAERAGESDRMEVHKYECRQAPGVWHTSSTPRLFEGVHEVTKKGVSGLDPADVAKIAEKEFGCTVEDTGKQFKIFPPDKSHAPVFVASRFNNGTGRSNALAQLRRAGVDIIAFLEDQRTKTKESTVTNTNGAPTPPPLTHRPPVPTVQDPPRQPHPGRPTPTKISSPPAGITELKAQLDNVQSQINDLLEMMVTAERDITTGGKNLAELGTEVAATLTSIEARVGKLETADATRNEAIRRLQTQRSQSDARILALEKNLPVGDVERVDPLAVLDAAILAVMDSTPMRLTSAVITAALPDELADVTSNQVGKRLLVLAAAGEVEAVERAWVSKMYSRVKKTNEDEQR